MRRTTLIHEADAAAEVRARVARWLAPARAAEERRPPAPEVQGGALVEAT